jgi:hypothetical protein
MTFIKETEIFNEFNVLFEWGLGVLGRDWGK